MLLSAVGSTPKQQAGISPKTPSDLFRSVETQEIAHTDFSSQKLC